MQHRLGALLAIIGLSQSAIALDFVSAERPTILYDGPSDAAAKIAVVSAGYPLEKIISVAGWVKVRDETGSLLWIDETALSNKRTVLIKSPAAEVLEKPADNAAPSFRVAQGVVLEVLAIESAGWIKVRHATGQEGYLRATELWGL